MAPLRDLRLQTPLPLHGAPSLYRIARKQNLSSSAEAFLPSKSLSDSRSEDAHDSPRQAEGFSFYEGAKTDSETTAQVMVRKGGQLVLTQAAVATLGDGVQAV